MSKILSVFFALVLSTQIASAQDFEFNPDRPSRPNRPNRPEDRPDRPNRPEDRPGRPGNERPPVGRVVFRQVDSFRVHKIIETTKTIRVNLNYVKAIKIKALNNSVELIEARALLDNGREVYMDSITGGIRDGREVIYTFGAARGQGVRSITIRAVTRSLTGSRADIEVSAGVLQ